MFASLDALREAYPEAEPVWLTTSYMPANRDSILSAVRLGERHLIPTGYLAAHPQHEGFAVAVPLR